MPRNLWIDQENGVYVISFEGVVIADSAAFWHLPDEVQNEILERARKAVAPLEEIEEIEWYFAQTDIRGMWTEVEEDKLPAYIWNTFDNPYIDLLDNDLAAMCRALCERDLRTLRSIDEARRERHEEQYQQTRRSQDTEGYVYLLRSDIGLYKIGKSKDPASRIRTFGIKLPFRVEYEHVIHTSAMTTLELELHHRYADKRMDGEWFALTPEDVDAIRAIGDST